MKCKKIDALCLAFVFLVVCIILMFDFDGKDRPQGLMGSKKERAEKIAEPTAFAIYHLALPYMSDEQADMFEEKLGGSENGHEYITLAIEMAFIALYGINENDRVETLMMVANQKMEKATLSDRQVLILELLLSYTEIAVLEHAAVAEDDIQRAMKKNMAVFMKYTEHVKERQIGRNDFVQWP